jgi:hypothetical protein
MAKCKVNLFLLSPDHSIYTLGWGLCHFKKCLHYLSKAILKKGIAIIMNSRPNVCTKKHLHRYIQYWNQLLCNHNKILKIP